MKNLDLQRMFDFFDFEKDGIITKKEFAYRMNNTDFKAKEEADPI